MKCGEAIIATLARYGASMLFGIPGVHTLEFYRGIATSTIESVLTRHEQGASFMADGYARATGQPAICCIISGPGVTNAATGVGQAYSDSIPVFVLASGGRRDHEGQGRGHLHECKEQRLIMEPITARAVRAESQSELPQLIATLWSTMTGPRPRPVYLEVPIDLLDEEVVTPWPFTEPQTQRAVTSPDRINDAAEVIAHAQSPLLILGGGARGAATEVLQLAHLLNAPVITTIAGKGIIDENEPIVAGQVMKRAAVRAEIADRDVVIAIGTELASTETNCDYLPLNGRLIRIDIDDRKQLVDYADSLLVVADAASAITSLISALSDFTSPRTAQQAGNEASHLRDIARQDAPAYHAWHRHVLDEVFAQIGSDALIYSDMTQLAYSGAQNVSISANARWNHPSGFGTLGYAVPAAIGGCIAAPDRRVIAIVGDGGFMYTMAELATAVEQSLNLTIIVWNNAALGQIRGDMVNRGIPEHDVKPTPPHFEALAESMGFRTLAPQSLAAIQGAMEEAGKGGQVLVLLDENKLRASAAD